MKLRQLERETEDGKQMLRERERERDRGFSALRRACGRASMAGQGGGAEEEVFNLFSPTRLCRQKGK